MAVFANLGLLVFAATLGLLVFSATLALRGVSMAFFTATFPLAGDTRALAKRGRATALVARAVELREFPDSGFLSEGGG